MNSHTFYIGYEGPDYNIELTMLVPEIEKKLAFRKKSIEEVRGIFEHKKPRYKSHWKTRLENQMEHLDEFDTVWRFVHQQFRIAKLVKALKE